MNNMTEKTDEQVPVIEVDQVEQFMEEISTKKVVPVRKGAVKLSDAKKGGDDILGTFEPVTYFLIDRNVKHDRVDEQWITVHPKDYRTDKFITPAPISIKFNYGIYTATTPQDVRKLELMKQALALTGRRTIKTISDIEGLADTRAIDRERQTIVESNLPDAVKKKLIKILG